MHYLIYIDVLFMVNFIMDYIVLSLVADILGYSAVTKVKMHSEYGRDHTSVIFCLRKIGAASSGALWVSLVLILRLKGVWWDIVTYLVISAFMASCIVNPREWQKLIKCILVMYFVTCALGGIMHVFYYYTAFGCMVESISRKASATAFLPVIFGAVILAPVIKLIVQYVSGVVSSRKIMPVVIIENNGRKLRLKALVDTGNSLTDPLNGGEVNVIEAKTAEALIESYADCHYHLVPFMSIGKEKGLIPVVRFDRLTIIGDEKHIVEKPLFALYSGRFSNSGYRVILHPGMLQDKTRRS